MFEEELELDIFKDNGYVRKICEKCGAGFWTLDQGKELCGDSQCCGYSFIFDPLIKEDLGLDEMRRRFLDYFKRNDHTEVDPYPVVARWRDDIYLTIASIADFQPHVTSGRVKPPANPLTISQPCIRLNDLDNVGRSGRHLTEFEMMAHHVFNRPEEEIYWKEDTVRYCNDFLVDDLGIPAETITYREEPWFGGGNAGPALEAEVGGLELATLVFMNMERDPTGDVVIGDSSYSKMDTYIVDTGYGLERFVWMSKGSPTLYEAIYPELLGEMFDEFGIVHDLEDPLYRDMLVEHVDLCGQMDISTKAGKEQVRQRLLKRLNGTGHRVTPAEIDRKMTPLENTYIIADHSRALAFMLGDGIVPSNIKEGYLARLLLRRSLRFLHELGAELDISWIVDRHISMLGNFPHLAENRDRILDMVSRETERYRKTLRKGKRIVTRKLEGKKVGKKEVEEKEISLEELIELYDSHGIHPSVVGNVMEEMGRPFTEPSGFSTLLAQKHGGGGTTEEEEEITLDYPPTELVFYGDEYERACKARVIGVEEEGLILDRTIFYSEGGGQPGDRGVIRGGDGEVKVTDTRKAGGVVYHVIGEGEVTFPEGAEVELEIDWERRYNLMRHHTATHVILGAAKTVLGAHVWQQGAQKFPDRGRFDISHFKRLTREEIDGIEMVANRAILEGRKVEKRWYTLDEAMDKYGSELFQGGAPAGDEIRIVEIEEWDREACAGTHVDNTSEIGMLKIIHTERLQDGVERLEYSVGPAAVERVQEMEAIIRRATEPIGVPPDKLPGAVERFFREWKEQQKEIKRLKEENARNLLSGLLRDAEEIDGCRFVFHRTSGDMEELQTLGRELIEEEAVIALLVSDGEGVKMVVARSADLDLNASEILRKGIRAVKGGGGGSPHFAQGGGKDPGGIPEAKEIISKEIKKRLEGNGE